MYSGLGSRRFSLRFITGQSQPRASSSRRSPTRLIAQPHTGGGQFPICRIFFVTIVFPACLGLRSFERSLSRPSFYCQQVAIEILVTVSYRGDGVFCSRLLAPATPEPFSQLRLGNQRLQRGDKLRFVSGGKQETRLF